ncbi:MAG TPA: hypothetical protein VJB14_04755, partial [Planctomycetota bacterium]|nr:hypothetical protein [Planctomycetota bacterium]
MATEIPEGVEKSVADWLASEEFDFGLGADRKLVVGRTAFVGYMPTVEEIKEVHGAYDAGLDPVLAIYSDGGPGGVAEPGRGGKVDATLRYLVRYGTTPERAKAMTERLM